MLRLSRSSKRNHNAKRLARLLRMILNAVRFVTIARQRYTNIQGGQTESIARISNADIKATGIDFKIFCGMVRDRQFLPFSGGKQEVPFIFFQAVCNGHVEIFDITYPPVAEPGFSFDAFEGDLKFRYVRKAQILVEYAGIIGACLLVNIPDNVARTDGPIPEFLLQTPQQRKPGAVVVDYVPQRIEHQRALFVHVAVSVMDIVYPHGGL